MARERRRPRRARESDPKLEVDEARQADDERENLRVLDVSLLLAVVAFIVLAVIFAIVQVG